MTDHQNIDLLRELLRLDPRTGRLYWRERRAEHFEGTATRGAPRQCAWWNARFAGKEALTALTEDGYRSGRILGRHYLAHRVVFALHNGRWPAGFIDHRDLDRANNLPGNLREASVQENNRNTGSRRTSTSAYCGVSLQSRSRKWVAQCSDPSGCNRYLGRFSTEEEAARAYDKAAARWHGDFARLNFPEASA